LFALKGNYDEGFGTRPHKEKWTPKDGNSVAPAADDGLAPTAQDQDGSHEHAAEPAI
jgi:hypothetical protein